MKQEHHRSQWTSRLGFILATAGAAIGLGNLWKFPYLMGRNGGFSFLAAYLVFVVVLGIPVMMLEMSLGRYTAKDPVASYRQVSPKAGITGVFGVLAAFIILSYYSVIGGWLIKYLVSYATTFSAPADFNAFIGSWEAVFWFFIFLAVTAFICLRGVSGIEKTSKIMMPLLFVLLLVIILRSVTLPGAMEGLAFIFVPGKGGAFTMSSVSAALGQVFYSMSLCMGITITYGSYLSKGENIPKSCGNVAAMDTTVAVLAGVAIFPAVFAFGLEPGQGPSLIFGTLPKVFGSLTGGPVFAIAFFVLILFAAVTSAIALLEVVVSYVVGSWGWTRKKAVLTVGLLLFIVGLPSSLSFGPLADFKIFGYTFFDFAGVLTDNILLPVGGILMCWFLGWKWNLNHLADEIEDGCPRFKLRRVWIGCIKYLTPVLVLVVTISGFIGIYQAVSGG
ncbi:MAG: sodium-dependent transporter [Oscillospiraceae bacterium]|nr:sodium-dependent transporter [Oscillospiraceae bacterium]